MKCERSLFAVQRYKMTDEVNFQQFVFCCGTMQERGGEIVDFRLIIDKEHAEEVVATVHERSALTEQIELLVMQYAGTDRVAAYTEDDMKMLSYEEIECITILDGKTYAINSRGDRYRLKQRLYELENMLPACFIRINKSSIANEKRLERFSAGFSGAVDAVFKSGYKEYVSRRCFAAIKRRYDAK